MDTVEQLLAHEPVRLLKAAEYVRLVEAGDFEDERVELLFGRIVEMTPQGPGHDYAIERLTRLLVRAAPDEVSVRVQSSFRTVSSVPIPDLALVPSRDYGAKHPEQAYLVIEVAKTSLTRDRGLKARLYAGAKVPEYWVVDVAAKTVEVHGDPSEGLYRSVEAHGLDATLQVAALAAVEVSVRDFLG